MKISGVVSLFSIMCFICLASGCERMLILDPETDLMTDNLISEDAVEDRNLYGLGDRELYGLEMIWIHYDRATFLETNPEDAIPVKAVNDFLIEKGHTPRVLATFYNVQGEGRLIEVVYIGSDIDPSLLFEELEMLPGVVIAGLKIVPQSPAILNTGDCISQVGPVTSGGGQRALQECLEQNRDIEGPEDPE